MSRPSAAAAAAAPPLRSNVDELNQLVQRWLSGDRCDDLRTAISDQLDVLLGLLQRLRDYKLTNPAHRASLGEAGLAAVRMWERMLADLPCGAVSDCPEGHPLKPRPNHPKGRHASPCRRHALTLPLPPPQPHPATAAPQKFARARWHAPFPPLPHASSTCSPAASAKRASTTCAAPAATPSATRKRTASVTRPGSTPSSCSWWARLRGEWLVLAV